MDDRHFVKNKFLKKKKKKKKKKTDDFLKHKNGLWSENKA